MKETVARRSDRSNSQELFDKLVEQLELHQLSALASSVN